MGFASSGVGEEDIGFSFAVSAFLSSAVSVMVCGAASQTLRFVKDAFIAHCKDSLKREIYLSKLLQKDEE